MSPLINNGSILMTTRAFDYSSKTFQQISNSYTNMVNRIETQGKRLSTSMNMAVTPRKWVQTWDSNIKAMRQAAIEYDKVTNTFIAKEDIIKKRGWYSKVIVPAGTSLPWKMVGYSPRDVQGIANASAAMADFAVKTQTSAAAIGMLSQRLQAGLGSLAKFAGTLQTTGLVMTATLTTGIIGLGSAASKVTIEYDKAMRNVQATGRLTEAQTKKISDNIIAMSLDPKKSVASPADLMSSFWEIQSAGIRDTASAQKVLEASTKAATAGLADQQTTARGLSQVVNAYGKDANLAADFANTMVRAVDVGVFTFDSLIGSMGKWLTTAGMVKAPFEEVAAGIATMSQMGMSADEAGTAMNRMLVGFLRPAPKVVEAAEKIGLDMSANTIKTKGFVGAMADINEKLGLYNAITAEDRTGRIRDIDDQITQTQNRIREAQANKEGTATLKTKLAALKDERTEIVDTIFSLKTYEQLIADISAQKGIDPGLVAQIFPDIRQLRGAYALLMDDMKAFNENVALLGDKTALQKVFDVQTTSFESKLQTIKNNFIAIGIVVGNIVLPIVIDFLNTAVIPLIDKFRMLTKDAQTGIIKLGMALAILGPTLLIAGVSLNIIATGLGHLVRLMTTLILGKFGAFALVGKVIKGIASFVGAPITAIALLIGAVALLKTAWQDNWLNIRDVVYQIAPDLAETIDKITSAIDKIGPAIAQVVDVIVAAVAPAIAKLAEFLHLVGLLAALKQTGLNIFEIAGGSALGFLNSLAQGKTVAEAMSVGTVTGISNAMALKNGGLKAAPEQIATAAITEAGTATGVPPAIIKATIEPVTTRIQSEGLTGLGSVLPGGFGAANAAGVQFSDTLIIAADSLVDMIPPLREISEISDKLHARGRLDVGGGGGGASFGGTAGAPTSSISGGGTSSFSDIYSLGVAMGGGGSQFGVAPPVSIGATGGGATSFNEIYKLGVAAGGGSTSFGAALPSSVGPSGGGSSKYGDYIERLGKAMGGGRSTFTEAYNPFLGNGGTSFGGTSKVAAQSESVIKLANEWKGAALATDDYITAYKEYQTLASKEVEQKQITGLTKPLATVENAPQLLGDVIKGSKDWSLTIPVAPKLDAKKAISSIASSFIGPISNAVSVAKPQAVSKAADVGKGIGGGIMEWIKNKLVGLPAWLLGLINGLLDSLPKIDTTIKDWYNPMESNPLEQVVLSIPNVADAYQSAMEQMAADTADTASQYFDDVGSELEDAAKKAKSDIEEALATGQKQAIDLYDVRGGTNGGGPLAAGANGPFESFYRLADISKNLGTPHEGVDTRKWYQMYFDGMGFDQAKEQATAALKNMEMGLWMEPNVQQYIGPDQRAQIADTVKQQMQGEDQSAAFAQSIADEFGLPFEEVIKNIAPNSKAATEASVKDIQTNISDAAKDLDTNSDIAKNILGIDSDNIKDIVAGTIGMFLSSMDTYLGDEKNQKSLKSRGESTWGYVEQGMIDKASTPNGGFYKAIEAMVLSIIGSND